MMKRQITDGIKYLQIAYLTKNLRCLEFIKKKSSEVNIKQNWKCTKDLNRYLTKEAI